MTRENDERHPAEPAPGRDPGLDRAVERSRRRRERYAREGERPLARNLAMIGSLGWLIVLPTLLGTLLGRWLDGLAGTGITLTAALMLVGLVLGCRLAWTRMHHE